MTKKTSLLFNLLTVLVQNFGHAEVERCLSRMTSGYTNAPRAAPKEKKRSIRAHKAKDFVEKLVSEPGRKDLLLQIAEQFDRKNFLPRIGDVQHFLKMRGHGPISARNRNEAFRALLVAIENLPANDLEKLARESAHMGPSQLGPLSDAIAATRSAIRSEDKAFLEDAIPYDVEKKT